MLALFGELDSQADWPESVAAYRVALMHDPDVTIRTFPGADHSLLASLTGTFDEMVRHCTLGTARPAPGTVEAVVDWLVMRGSAKESPDRWRHFHFLHMDAKAGIQTGLSETTRLHAADPCPRSHRGYGPTGVLAEDAQGEAGLTLISG